jgi:hypothetical protein
MSSLVSGVLQLLQWALLVASSCQYLLQGPSLKISILPSPRVGSLFGWEQHGCYVSIAVFDAYGFLLL